jgi:hypothetical protein
VRELQDLLNFKFGNTPFRVWHYYAVLTIMYIVLPLLPSALFQSGGSLLLLIVVMTAFSTLRQMIGYKLSRKGLDSVLVMRYFATIPWVILFIDSAIILQVGHFDDLTRGFYSIFFWGGLFVAAVNVLGIIIHYKKRKLTYKNIKKEDLFQ